MVTLALTGTDQLCPVGRDQVGESPAVFVRKSLKVLGNRGGRGFHKIEVSAATREVVGTAEPAESSSYVLQRPTASTIATFKDLEVI